jgi:hypothetical protein
MIISLFMDEAPLVCGRGDNLGARADGGTAGGEPGSDPRRRGDDRSDHEKHAEDVHVSAAKSKTGSAARPRARDFSW